MVLPMTSPHRHPRTGIYKFRKRVPERLRPILGRTEVTISLGTKNPLEARRRYPEVAAQVEREWAALEGREQTPLPKKVALSERQAQALAGEAYRRALARREDEPGSPVFRRLGAAKARSVANLAARRTHEEEEVELVEEVAGRVVDALLAARGLAVADETRLKACRAVALALAQAEDLLERRAAGDWSPDPMASRFPSTDVLEVLDWKAEFDRYASEAKLSAKTARSWRKRVGELMATVGSDDLRRLTPDHVEAWKSALVGSGLHVNTVRNGYLAAIKALCGFLSRKLPVNPCAGVTVRRSKVEKLRNKGFSIDEALVILRATLEPPPARLSPDQKAARRWVPWLCAYSGARVNEITQLRRVDVLQERSEGGDLVWMIRITPEAGKVKSREARMVPVHPHLVEQGFLDFVRDCRRETLFYDASRSRGGSQTHPLYQKSGERLAAWVRRLGIDDPGVDPNHAWRHRFRTVARAAGVADPTIDHLQGHAPATVGESYGDRWPKVLFDAVARLPRYEVGR